jgi:hypothetical protein
VKWYNSILGLLIGAIIGSFFGWTGCYLLSSKTAQVETHNEVDMIQPQAYERTIDAETITAREIRLVGNRGETCLVIRGESVHPIDADFQVGAFLDFYNPAGEVDYSLGRFYSGSFFIKRTDFSWMIEMPMEKFIYSRRKH